MYDRNIFEPNLMDGVERHFTSSRKVDLITIMYILQVDFKSNHFEWASGLRQIKFKTQIFSINIQILNKTTFMNH